MEALIARSNYLRDWAPLLTLVALMLAIGSVEPQFLSLHTLLDLVDDTVTLFVLATGVAFVVMIGGIDLSIQSMASLSSVIIALTVDQLGYGAFVLALAIDALS